MLFDFIWINLISPVFLFLFVSMLLSMLAGARAETILKFFIELMDFVLSLVIRFFYLMEFLFRSSTRLFLDCRAEADASKNAPQDPFPKKRRPKRENFSDQ